MKKGLTYLSVDALDRFQAETSLSSQAVTKESIMKQSNYETQIVMPVCSYFAQMGNKPVVKNMTPSTSWSLEVIYKYVRSNVAKPATEYLRTLKDEDAQKMFKTYHFDMIIPGGTLRSRMRGQNEVTPNGECCLDIDHICILQREKLFYDVIKDPNLTVDLEFRSPRGHGVKIFLRYDPQEISYKDFYIDACNYLRFNYGVMADSSCGDITHTCLLPWDDNAYINPNINTNANLYDNK